MRTVYTPRPRNCPLIVKFCPHPYQHLLRRADQKSLVCKVHIRPGFMKSSKGCPYPLIQDNAKNIEDLLHIVSELVSTFIATTACRNEPQQLHLRPIFPSRLLIGLPILAVRSSSASSLPSSISFIRPHCVLPVCRSIVCLCYQTCYVNLHSDSSQNCEGQANSLWYWSCGFDVRSTYTADGACKNTQ